MSNTVSFINEQVVYFYMRDKFDNNELYLLPIIKNGKLFDNHDRKEKIVHYKQVSGTRFPDIDEIRIEKEKTIRPAEVKFVTSKFNYHKEQKYINDYEAFKSKNGIIITVKHDLLPNGISLNSGIDIYQVDYLDFIQYCKENFSLLFSRQIDLHFHKNIWIMYASSNFFNQKGNILPACKTKRWAPSQNLGNLEIGIGDIILFIKCKGVTRIEAQKYFLENDRIPHPRVYLDRLIISEVKSNIFSREEYCYKNNLKFDDELWPDEIINGPKWDKIFDFEIIKSIDKEIYLNQLYKYSTKAQTVATFLNEVYQMPNLGRKITEENYMKLLEYII